MKKYILIFIMAILLILLIKFSCVKDSIDINGRILFNMNNNGNNEITVYDCSKEKFHKISTNGLQAVFSENNTILLNQFDIVSEYNLTTNDEIIIYQDEPFDYFAICNDNALSLSKDNYIFLYSKETKEKKILVQDNGSKIHSWSDDGEILYYSDENGRIKAINVLSGKVKEYSVGYDPVVCGTKLAYKNKDMLVVKNLQTEKEYRYDGSAYSYCFSPNSNAMLIEDEISIVTIFKNLFDNGIVLGHSVVVWDYASNKRKTLIDSCISIPNLICDWK